MKKLVTALFALALVALVFEIGVRTFDSIAAGEIGLERRLRFDRLEHIKAALQVRLNSPEACTHMLKSQSGRPGEEVTVNADMEGLLGDSVTRTELTVESIRLAVNGRAQMVLREPDAGRELIRYSAVLKLTMNLNLGERDPETRQVSIPFLVWLNNEGQVDSCFGDQSLGSLCNATGGYYQQDGDGRCRKTITLHKRARGRWEARGACHFGGIVANPNQCGTLQARKLQAVLVQQEFVYPDAYVCQRCE